MSTEKDDDDENQEELPKHAPVSSSSANPQMKLQLHNIPPIPLSSSSSASSINDILSPKPTSPGHTIHPPPTTATSISSGSFPRLIPIPNISTNATLAHSLSRPAYKKSSKEGSISLSSAPLSAIIKPTDPPQSSIKDGPSDHSFVSSASSVSDNTSPFKIDSQSQSEMTQSKRQVSQEGLQSLPVCNSTSSDIIEKQGSNQQFLLLSQGKEEEEDEDLTGSFKVDASVSRSLEHIESEPVPAPPLVSDGGLVSSNGHLKQVLSTAVLPKTSSLSTPITPSSSVPLVAHSFSDGSVVNPLSLLPTPLPTLTAGGPVPSKSTEGKSLQELLRTLAVEELTSAVSSNIMKSSADNEKPTPSVSNESSIPGSPLPSSQPKQSVLQNELMQQEAEQWKTACEEERERVRELEEQIKDHERRKDKLQLDYGQQIKDLRKELLDLRAKLRKSESEKVEHKPSVSNEEQERLIQGYQKENERLYAELTLTSKEFKSTKAQLLEDNNKLATELANMRAKHDGQDQVIRHLRQQIESYSYKLHTDTNNDDDINIRKKLEESVDNCQKLQCQLEEVIAANKGLEEQLLAVQIEKHDSVEGTLINEIKDTYDREVSQLQMKLKTAKEDYDSLRRQSEALLQEKDAELKSIKDSMTATKQQQKKDDSYTYQKGVRGGGGGGARGGGGGGGGGGPRLIKSRAVADSKRIKELEHQVNELQLALKKRHPNSIPALIYATNNEAERKEPSEGIVSYLESKVQRLEGELGAREEEVTRKMEEMKKQFEEMECLYEEQIDSLKNQVSLVAAQAKSDSRGATRESSVSTEEKTLKSENTQLKEQVSKLTLEIKHQRLQLEGLAAQAEGERRKTKEKWEHKIKKIEKAYSEKMDSLVANLVQERSDSNLARLKTRLASREARIKQLEQEIEILRVDEEAVAVTKSLEEELRSQVELLTSELEESKKHHTPEMHHFNSLLAKISHLENKLSEYEKRLQETADKSGLVPQEQLKQLELKYRRQLSEKNKQIDKFREELDTLMDTLYSLQESNSVIKR
ncbi:PREDICTED: centrosomal protein of 162 kDa-like [Amphimedon queenslandica]|nr:PREDICTED: centrosomal protein of 162 kDa-like [Amphimedon queenslandica]|eukprot:XP_019854310.1 PREDICTED: centrosomal protein of 162 kDa-like [Amphimedon queenslandica]